MKWHLMSDAKGHAKAVVLLDACEKDEDPKASVFIHARANMSIREAAAFAREILDRCSSARRDIATMRRRGARGFVGVQRYPNWKPPPPSAPSSIGSRQKKSGGRS